MTKTIFSIAMLALSVGCSGGGFESNGNPGTRADSSMGGETFVDDEPALGAGTGGSTSSDETGGTGGVAEETGGTASTGGSGEETGGMPSTGGTSSEVICNVNLPEEFAWLPPEESISCTGECFGSASPVWTAPKKLSDNVWGVQWVSADAEIFGDVTAWNGNELATVYEGSTNDAEKNSFEITFDEDGNVASVSAYRPDVFTVLGLWGKTPSSGMSMETFLARAIFDSLNDASLTCK